MTTPLTNRMLRPPVLLHTTARSPTLIQRKKVKGRHDWEGQFVHHAPTNLCTLLCVGGYDSDVEREKSMDYVSKTYSDPIRDAASEGKLKPHQQQAEEGGGGRDTQRAKVSRTSSTTARVASKDDVGKRVDVS